MQGDSNTHKMFKSSTQITNIGEAICFDIATKILTKPIKEALISLNSMVDDLPFSQTSLR